MEANGCVQRLDLAEIFTTSMLKLKIDEIGLETSQVRMSLRNDHFQIAARGPLKYVGPGPARRILKMFISKKTKEGGAPMFT